ncbi:MAG: hypothetical protein QXZ44_03230 [Ferroplasma sp.]
MMNNIKVCPHCELEMELKEAPYMEGDKKIGDFEAYVCPNCGRVFYTSNGYAELNKFIMKKKE